MQWAIDQVCHDVKDRPLLWMKEEGIFTDGEIGEVLELKEKQIRKRLRRMRKELEDLFELRRRKCDKDKKDKEDKKEKGRNAASDAARNVDKRQLGQEFMVRWREAKLVARIALPTRRFLLLPATADPPQFRPTSALTADRAWHLRHFALTPNSHATVKIASLPLFQAQIGLPGSFECPCSRSRTPFGTMPSAFAAAMTDGQVFTVPSASILITVRPQPRPPG